MRARRSSTIVKPLPRAPPRMPRMVPPPMKEEEQQEAEEAPPAKQEDAEGPRSSIVRAPPRLAEQRLKRGLRPGQLDPDAVVVAHRVRELAGRRSYLRNFWYAAGAGRSTLLLPMSQPVTHAPE